jgi:hypothetical protein
LFPPAPARNAAKTLGVRGQVLSFIESVVVIKIHRIKPSAVHVR